MVTRREPEVHFLRATQRDQTTTVRMKGTKHVMAQYQCLIVDCNDNVRGIESIDADDNDEALRKSRSRFPLNATTPLVEVWCKGQCVGRVSFDPTARDRT